MSRLDEDPERRKAEFRLKLEYLLREPHPRRIAGGKSSGLCADSYPSLAEAIGIGRRNHSQVHWGEGRLSDRVVNRILNLYAIPASDDCAREFREGYAKNFIREFKRLHPESAEDQAPNDVLSLPVPIAAGEPQKPQDSKPVGLASVGIEGSQYGFGTVSVQITVACGIWQGATISGGRVILDCSPAKMTPDSFKGWVGKTRVFETTTEGGAKGRVLLAFGGTHLALAWRVTAIEGSVGTFWVDPDFAALVGLAPRGRVTVSFGTWLSEIEDTDDAPAGDGLVLVDHKGQALKLPAEELSKKKRKVIASIRKVILDAKPDGYVDLASHTLVVIGKKP